MARSGFPADRALSARMLATMVLLGVVYAAFVMVLLAVGVPAVLVVLLGGGLLVVQYRYSDRLVLAALGAREVDRSQAPELYTTVERLVALADMPMPRVAVADTGLPNALATGRSPAHAVVAVTTGLLRRLDPPELEAVLAHELSHVAHRDVLVMTVAGFLGLVAGFLTRWGLHASLWGGYRRRSDGPPVFLLMVVASAVVYALSFLLTRALSRYRELSADRSGAVLTGRPSALASALVKISEDLGRVPTDDLREAEPVNAFLLAPAVARGFSLSSLFATHPPLERRLDQLARLQAQLERPA